MLVFTQFTALTAELRTEYLSIGWTRIVLVGKFITTYMHSSKLAVVMDHYIIVVNMIRDFRIYL